MVAQNKPIIFVSLSGIDWRDQLCLAIDQDGDGNGHLLGWEGDSRNSDGTMSQAEYDDLVSGRVSTPDDLLRLCLGLNGGNPGLTSAKMVNCGQSLAKMGRMVDLMPNSFSRSAQSPQPASGATTALAINKVHNLVTTGNLVGNIFLLDNGVNRGDQIDFTNEGAGVGFAISGSIKDQANNVLRSLTLLAGQVFYFTATWNGNNWVVAQ
jgi:hypothetical protein